MPMNTLLSLTDQVCKRKDLYKKKQVVPVICNKYHHHFRMNPSKLSRI